MFVLAGKELTGGPKPNLLLKAGLAITPNQASQAFFPSLVLKTPRNSHNLGPHNLPGSMSQSLTALKVRSVFFLASPIQSVSTSSLSRCV